MPAATVSVGPVTVTYVHEDPTSGYALLEWEAPPGAASPPVHVHHRTDEGFYVLSGAYRFLVDGKTIEAPAGSHVLVRAGLPLCVYPSDLEPSARWYGRDADVIKLSMSKDGRMAVPGVSVARLLDVGRFRAATRPVVP